MKRTGMDRDILYLPEEIIRSILKRLPVKFLIRFLCVCKRWKNLIQNPSFIADHLQQSTHRNDALLFKSSSHHFALCLLDCGLQVRVVLKIPLMDFSDCATVLGSCNGLLLLGKCNLPFALWNPATKAVRHVPRNRTEIDISCHCVTGFGFSPIVNDYKIVRTYPGIDDTVDRAYVFSLSRGSWRGIDVGNLKGVKLDFESVTANGAIFWYGVKSSCVWEKGEYDIEAEEDEDDMEEGEHDVEVVVSFDIAKEVFTLIPRPNLEYNAEEKLTVYENKLAVLCDIWKDDETTGFIDLWVLDEGTCVSGETWRWTKRHTSSPFSFRLDSRTIWRNEIVCNCDDEGTGEIQRGKAYDLYLMNLSTKEAKRLVIPRYRPSSHIYHYAESLVSFGNN
ncbi:hypothetical protein QN277_009158 [Acacia crassicarpa]|uniref:F-box domain-containing protein n=1 Tax=Acacia crassicarpa TaxID=499986 RepID=A0AAE1IUB4_9FABA|nr:hypothetical protein QN277_009158 [Acacia crassicarpa]